MIRENWDQIAGSTSDSAEARRILVVFSDYQCPFCRLAEDQLTEVAAGENFRIVYRHYPVAGLHPRAEEAARAAICAEEMGVFRVVHDYLMRERWWEDSTPLSERPAELGVPQADTPTFLACLTSETVEQRLGEDRELAGLLGVGATPTFVGVNGIQVGFHGGSRVTELLGSVATSQR